MYMIEFLGVVVILLMTTMSAAGGVGGGTIVMPIFKIFFGFSQR